MVPGVPAKSFTMWMSDWEPGVTIVNPPAADCAWVDGENGGRLSGAAMPSLGRGRAPTSTSPMNSAWVFVSCSVDVVVPALALVVTAVTPGEKTTGRVRRAMKVMEKRIDFSCLKFCIKKG